MTIVRDIFRGLAFILAIIIAFVAGSAYVFWMIITATQAEWALFSILSALALLGLLVLAWFAGRELRRE